MKILSAGQIHHCDEYTIKDEPISSLQLMERAALACVDWISENCKNHRNFTVFCGNGNNGGDGFAIARMLYQKGFDVDVFMNSKAKYSSNANENFKELKDLSGVLIKNFKDAENYRFDSRTVIIDALFGIGLSRNIESELKDLINFLNQKNNIRISIDVPSGLFIDQITDENSTVLKADYTLSFQLWKKSFLHPESGKFTGKVEILDIDVSGDCLDVAQTHDFVINEETVKSIFKPRNDFSHKGTYGKATIVAGSYGKTGAAVLATKAALKTGAGLVFVQAPKCGYEILQTSCPEAMFIEAGDHYLENFELNDDSVYGIGPGIGKNAQTQKGLISFLKEYAKPVVLDADALNNIAETKGGLQAIPKKSIITPHPKEFERLFGATKNSFERTELARKNAAEFDFIIVLKDHHTQIITPEGNVFYNLTGNSGLAKGGSGDILTGIITSFLAQGYAEEDAAILGVWFHGKAADLAAKKHSKEAMLPSDVISEFGKVFEKINETIQVKL